MQESHLHWTALAIYKTFIVGLAQIVALLNTLNNVLYYQKQNVLREHILHVGQHINSHFCQTSGQEVHGPICPSAPSTDEKSFFWGTFKKQKVRKRDKLPPKPCLNRNYSPKYMEVQSKYFQLEAPLLVCFGDLPLIDLSEASLLFPKRVIFCLQITEATVLCELQISRDFSEAFPRQTCASI